MGLLDSLLNMAGGSPKATESNKNAVTSIMDILVNNQQTGGLDGLVGKLTKAGLGNAVDSWISTGKNKSVKSSQLNNALGSDVISQIAAKLGVSNTAASGMLAKFLPMIIDKLTPDGKTSSTSQINVQDILGKILKK
ncbi:MAG: DUF937 domain-containing protein [Bacteroidales bacterium]|nr:DUF937 domain-containing protein [Bacteroidales bacterium]